ncbi:hypothetical protein CPB84DRAFT_1757642 [Gymnopilus junonius]|uniref:DUF7719 domain-containing protein n=1 Tax=Gymnopilus junonius TaxID=109634 RepID=A0A9P5P166_GYMJU|nr:hypothetical protein CPB84DRAFT_1757642 [Gymnopilus junonius]
MARSGKKAYAKSIPLVSASSVKLPATGKPLIDISEEEQWRLINQTEILQSSEAAFSGVAEPEISPLADEIFNALFLIIPFSSILLLMEILIRHQYGKEASVEVIKDRMLPGVPILSIFIFYTTRYKQDRRIQLFLFVISTLVGSRMLYLWDNASFLVIMKQCPPLVTVWIYTIVQLDLGAAVTALVVVGGFVWWQDITVVR